MAALLSFYLPVYAEVYVWVDNAGKKHFSDVKPAPSVTQKSVEEVYIETAPAIDEIAIARQRALLRHLESSEQQSAKDKDKAKKLRDKQRKSCAKVKRMIARDKHGGVYYSYNKAGKKVMWSHEKRKAYSADLRQRKKSLCG